MGCVFDVQGAREIILDPVEDLKDLIGKYVGTDARELYAEIIQNYEDQLAIRQEDYYEKSQLVDEMEGTIDDCRYEIGMVLEDLKEEVDLAEVRRRLENVYWDLGY